DINRQALAKARRGLYSQWSFREVPAEIQANYFISHSQPHSQPPSLEVAPRLLYLVTTAYLNLVEDTYPSLLTNTHAMDLILCRNVFIYFREPVIRRVVGRFHDALAEAGWLIVGHAEPSQAVFQQFTVRNFP